MTEVRLSGVSKRYDRDVAALEATDVTVASGEFFTLLGPSGCGKTTTLRIVAGFETPTTGRVHFDDREVTSLPPERRGLGMVFQSYALFPHLDVAENIGYGLRNQKVSRPEARARVAAAIDSVGLTGLAARSIGELSGGQQQRVALARALVVAPQVLLLDEPLSNLDARLRDDTRTQVRALQREAGITTLYVTHDQAEALAVSDRIAVLDHGRVHQIGTPWQIYHRPATTFVAGFIGRANLLDGTVTAAERSTVTVRLPGGRTLRAAVGRTPPAVAERVTLAVRPERIRLVAPGEGTIDAIVRTVEFLGSHSLIEVAPAAGSGAAVIRVTLDEDGVAPAALRAGEAVGLDLEAAGAWVVGA